MEPVAGGPAEILMDVVLESAAGGISTLAPSGSPTAPPDGPIEAVVYSVPLAKMSMLDGALRNSPSLTTSSRT